MGSSVGIVKVEGPRSLEELSFFVGVSQTVSRLLFRIRDYLSSGGCHLVAFDLWFVVPSGTRVELRISRS